MAESGPQVDIPTTEANTEASTKQISKRIRPDEENRESSPFDLCSYVLNLDLGNPSMMQAFTVRRLKVTSSIPAKSFAHEFLKSASLQAAAAKVGATNYLASLARLCELESKDLAVTSTEYELVNPAHSIELYDIKCRARFEDDIIERIYRDWPSKSKMDGIVCPLRRGVCVGLIDKKDLILAVGNAKFYYGTDEEILAPLKKTNNSGTVVLTEKANGEYTMMSCTNTESSGTWLTVGSKNVRLCLPYFQGDSSSTRTALDSILFTFSNNNANKEEGHRFSYLKEMLDLWLRGLESNAQVLEELRKGATLIGEQVGVHAHIYTGYKSPHIRLFALLPWERLHTDFACDLKDLKRRIFKNSEGESENKKTFSSGLEDDIGEEEPLMLVKAQEFSVPEERSQLLTKLRDVAAGSMNVYGEGVVAYVYSPENTCLDLFKYKCEEYAYDRRIRTLVSKIAGDLYRNSSNQVTRLRLQNDVARLETELKKSATNQFTRINRERVQGRIEMVPAMLAFLEKHQASVFCEDFSEHFVDFLTQVEARKSEYLKLAADTFLKASDPLGNYLEAFLNQFEAIHVPFRSAEDIAEELFKVYMDSGGFPKCECIGIASMPGGGKTAVLRALLAKFEAEKVPVKLCDRDAYVIADPTARGDQIHKVWTEDISRTVREEKKVCLVGNTFSGTFADKFEAQTKTKLLLFTLREATHVQTRKNLLPSKKSTAEGTCDRADMPRCRAAVFNLECLRRLSRREETFSDGSTLTMGLGATIVLEKFFSSQPEPKMLERRLKAGTAHLVDCIPQTSFDFKQASELAEGLAQLKNHTANPPSNKAKVNEEEHEKIQRTIYQRATAAYVGKGDGSGVMSRTKFVGLAATAPCAKQLLPLGDVDIYRTDCHVTLVFAPSPEEMRAFIRHFEAVQTIHAPIVARVTVLKNHKGRVHKLQFLVLGQAHEENIRKFIPSNAHVTLGSTNPSIIPHSKSGDVLRELLESNAMSLDEVYRKSPSEYIQLKDGLQARIEALPLDNMEFVGVPSFFYLGK